MNRIEKVRALLSKYQIEALVIDNPLDLYYLTGLDFSMGRLVITDEGPTLYVDGRYYEAARKALFFPVILSQGYHETSPFAESWSFAGKKVGFDGQTTSYASYLELQQLKSEWIPLDAPVKWVRAVKEEEEIKTIKKASLLGSVGFDHVISLLEEGITEEKLALELELFWRKNGGERLSFSPLIAFGENAAFPHHRADKRALKKGDVVLIDIGVVYDHYHSDMTRVVFFEEVPSILEKIYLIVQEAQSCALKACRPGVATETIDHAARAWISQSGYGDYFSHGLGHGVGLEIHEFPVLKAKRKEILQEGMVVTIEPGIYLPGIGGVRLEDEIVITKSGYENLTSRPLAKTIPIIKRGAYA